MEIEIEKGIPIPVAECKHPWLKLSIGDSFVAKEWFGPWLIKWTKRNNPGWGWVTKKEASIGGQTDRIRIWRSK